MATTTPTNASTINDASEDGGGLVDLRMIPLSRIVVAEGFNPRGEVAHDAELEAMAETMRQRGCLQPVRVRASDTGTGDYVLIAGERRYRAAVIAVLTELPAIVRPAGAGDERERLELLTDAMIENEVRCDLNPLQRAQNYQELIGLGLSVRGIAERMGGKAKRGSREKMIRGYLAILDLPEKVRELVAVEKVPLLAVKALTGLTAIHEELPGYAVAAVLDVDKRTEPQTWANVAEDALEIALWRCESLPSGLFTAPADYPLENFELGEKAQRDLAAYEKLTGKKIVQAMFSFDQIEQARALGAARELDYGALIVSQDVANTLAEDYIAARLKQARAQTRREREIEKERHAAGDSANGSGVQAGQAQGSSGGKADQQDPKAEREEAIQFNLDLGILAFKHLPRIKVDERVLRILSSVDIGGSLSWIAARGARLSLPGWMTQTQQKNGKTKTTYVDGYDAGDRAMGFLEGAESQGDIAGRTLTLIALASLADEEHTVAFSRQSHYTLTFSGPWAAQAERDLYAIVRERIKEGQLPALDEILAERIADAEAEARIEQETASASASLQSASGRLAELDESELDQALSDADRAWGRFNPKTLKLRTEITAVREQRAAATAGEHEHSDEQATAAA